MSSTTGTGGLVLSFDPKTEEGGDAGWIIHEAGVLCEGPESVPDMVKLLRALMDVLIDEDSGMSVAEAVEHGISGISCEISESTRREMEEYGRYMKSASKILRGLVEGDTP